MTDIKSDFDQSQTDQSQNDKQGTQPGDYPFIIVTKHKDGTKDIHIHDLTVKLPPQANSRVLAQDVNLVFKPGDIVAIMGGSGSGKTTVAKAILNNWDHGSGLIVMPDGMEVASMPQQAYFPDSSLRAIMNLKPEDECTFDDERLTEVLQKVGLEQLVQYIPGQQVQIMMDELLEKIEATSKKEDIISLIAPLVEKNFSSIQYVPEAQKSYLREKLESVFGKEESSTIMEDIVQEIDRSLAQPLYDDMCANVESEMDRKYGGKVLPYTADKAAYFSWRLNRKLNGAMLRYIKNEDTDDKDRPIQINETQVQHVIKGVVKHVEQEMNEKYVSKGALTTLFNVVSSPLNAWRWLEMKLTPDLNMEDRFWSLKGMASASLNFIFNIPALPFAVLGFPITANAPSKNIMQGVTSFMGRHLITGDPLSRQLSGGEQQRLMIAIGLLNDAHLYVLDEPTAGLDPKSKERIYRETIASIPKGAIVLCITHDESIIKYHTHLAVLEDQTIKMKKLDPNDHPSVRASCVNHECSNCIP